MTSPNHLDDTPVRPRVGDEAYEAPTLQSFGSIADVTEAGDGTLEDNPSNPFSFSGPAV